MPSRNTSKMQPLLWGWARAVPLIEPGRRALRPGCCWDAACICKPLGRRRGQELKAWGSPGERRGENVCPAPPRTGCALTIRALVVSPCPPCPVCASLGRVWDKAGRAQCPEAGSEGLGSSLISSSPALHLLTVTRLCGSAALCPWGPWGTRGCLRPEPVQQQ